MWLVMELIFVLFPALVLAVCLGYLEPGWDQQPDLVAGYGVALPLVYYSAVQFLPMMRRSSSNCLRSLQLHSSKVRPR
jgi:hypothetical protein